MKRISKPRLALRKETVRALEKKELAEVAAGMSAVCPTVLTCNHTGGYCGGNSAVCTLP